MQTESANRGQQIAPVLSGPNFKFVCVIQDDGPGGYTDWQFSDGNPRHSHILSRDNSTGEFYAILQTSETDDSEFDGDDPVDAAGVEAMRALLPAALAGAK